MTVRNDSSVVNRNKTLDYQAKISIRFGFISFCQSDDPLIQPVPHYDYLFHYWSGPVIKTRELANSVVLDGFFDKYYFTWLDYFDKKFLVFYVNDYAARWNVFFVKTGLVLE